MILVLEFSAMEPGIPWPIKKYERFDNSHSMMKRLGELIAAGFVVTVHPLPAEK